jgi:carboxyl-terminal processing protease
MDWRGEFAVRHQRRFITVLSGALLGSFTLGLSFPEVLAGVERARLAQGGLPERYAHRWVGATLVVAQPGQAQDLPLRCYQRTLGYLRQRYLGEMGSDVTLTYAAIRGMIRPLDDPYTRFLDPEQYRDMRERNRGEYIGVGALLEPFPTRDGYVRVHMVLPGTLADKAGLRPFDVILSVDGASTRNIGMRRVERMLRGREGTPVRLLVRRRAAAKPLPLKIPRQPVELEIVECRMLPGSVGLISLAEFNERSDEKIDRALTRLERQGMRALILDLRGNGGGVLDAAQEVASRFLPRGKTVVTILEKGGEPEIRPVLERQHNHPFNQAGHMLPLAVLVNRMSASAAEIVAGAIKDHHTGVIVGTPTYGKGLVQTVVPLRGGSAIAITSARYLTPSGRDINRGNGRSGGITPDVLVEATEEDWLNQNDVQLQKALDLLHERTGYKRPVAGPTQLSTSRPERPTAARQRRAD